MLDEFVETGYTATELGDWGFMPTEPFSLHKEVEARRLTVLGAFAQVAFKKPEAFAPGKEEVVKIARLLAASSPEHNRYIILAFDNASDPTRTQNAGRVTPEIGLSRAKKRHLQRLYKTLPGPSARRLVCRPCSTTTAPDTLRPRLKSTGYWKTPTLAWSIWRSIPVTTCSAAEQAGPDRMESFCQS